jgi:hypothetical protein
MREEENNISGEGIIISGLGNLGLSYDGFLAT